MRAINILAVCVLATGSLPVLAVTEIRYVDASCLPSSCGDGADWNTPYGTIAEAVDELNQAIDGSTVHNGEIHIDEGSYIEEEPIILEKPIKIIGAGMGVTSWEYSNTSGSAVEIASTADGSVLTKLTIRPTKLQSTADNFVYMRSSNNGGIHINGAEDVSIDQVLLLYFGGQDQSGTNDPVYANPSLGNSYCLKVSGEADNIKVINSQFTFCNNAIVVLGLKSDGLLQLGQSVTHFSRRGPALYVSEAVAPTAEIQVSNSWFAMKKDATPRQPYSKYLVYLGGGHSAFSNTETELDITSTSSMKSHHIYVGTDDNIFTNHFFVGGASPEHTGSGPGGCSTEISNIALYLNGDDNTVGHYIATDEGCGTPKILDKGTGNNIWTSY